MGREAAYSATGESCPILIHFDSSINHICDLGPGANQNVVDSRVWQNWLSGPFYPPDRKGWLRPTLGAFPALPGDGKWAGNSSSAHRPRIIQNPSADFAQKALA